MTQTSSADRWPKTVTLLAALVDPRLEGAACAGRAPWFDEFVDGETTTARTARLDAARTICGTCPVRIACATAATEHQSTGIWAGQLRNPTGTPGRKRKGAA